MESAKSILVVDGDPSSRRRIIDSLEPGRWSWIEAESAEAALEVAKAAPPDLVILDRSLPDISGLGLCRMLRETLGLTRVPLVMVSAQGGEIDRVLAFEAGADDFLTKPFYPPELGARVRAILRGFASGETTARSVASQRVVHIDTERGRAEVEGRPIDLTQTEFQILSILVSRDGKVVRRRDLIESLWGPEASLSERAIDAHVKSIRRKLGDARGLLETVRGVGYRFSEPR